MLINPAAPSQLRLVATIIPTAVAAIDALTAFGAGYDNYRIVLQGLKPAADDALTLRLANAGVVDVGAVYSQASTNLNAGAAIASMAVLGATALAAGTGISGVIDVLNCNDAAGTKTLVLGSSGGATGGYFVSSFRGAYSGAAVSGFRLYWSSAANFSATGKILVYGFANT